MKYLASLKLKKFRQREGKFLIEGDNLITSALASGVNPEELLYSVNYGHNNIDSLTSKNQLKMTFLTNIQMKKLSDVATPPGIIALMRLLDSPFDEFIKCRKLLFLDGVSDPGNAGTLVRNACAFGFAGTMLSPNSCELYNPKFLRSTSGYVFQTKVSESVSYDQLLQLKDCGFRLISASPKAETSIEEQTCPEKAVLILGNEPRGVSEEVERLVDMKIRIPLAGEVDSLNVAAAGAIMMFWARDRRID